MQAHPTATSKAHPKPPYMLLMSSHLPIYRPFDMYTGTPYGDLSTVIMLPGGVNRTDSSIDAPCRANNASYDRHAYAYDSSTFDYTCDVAFASTRDAGQHLQLAKNYMYVPFDGTSMTEGDVVHLVPTLYGNRLGNGVGAITTAEGSKHDGTLCHMPTA